MKEVLEIPPWMRRVPMKRGIGDSMEESGFEASSDMDLGAAPSTNNTLPATSRVLLLVAGAKGAVGSTLAVAVAAMKDSPDLVLPSLATESILAHLGIAQETEFAGWDISPLSLAESLPRHGVLPEEIWGARIDLLSQAQIKRPPPPSLSLGEQVERIIHDLEDFKSLYPGFRPVLVDLLPACGQVDLSHLRRLDQLLEEADPSAMPDLAYAVAAVLSGVPVVNFTSNPIEAPGLVSEAELRGVPMAGRDGKTGQTYLKVVLASALRARNLRVNGWYSLNILGNEDGRNLRDPKRAEGKIANKTGVLDEVLGYKIGEGRDGPCHKVRIDYYPLRGDAKEAWDVIDFAGLFGLPMSMRVNLMARDSVLAAPLVMDLANWMVALQEVGRAGLVSELAFYFKRPLGPDPPLRFQEQIWALEGLERECRRGGW